MNNYVEKRKGKRVSNDTIAYFLDKYREDFHKMENERRRVLKCHLKNGQ